MDHGRGRQLANPTGGSVQVTAAARGFTLLELLVVFAILAVLMAIMAPSMAGVKNVVRRITCGSNMRQLMVAYHLYNHEWGVLPQGNSWSSFPVSASAAVTRGWNYWPNSNVPEAITTGALYPYLNDMSLYKCPASWFDYYSTYTINWTVNGERYNEGTFTKMSQIPDPAGLICLVEEYDNRGWNLGSMVLKFGPQFDWPAGEPNQWCDGVAGQHLAGYDQVYLRDTDAQPRPARGDNFSFVDGHVEFWVWKDYNTLFNDPGGHNRNDNDNTDLQRIKPVFCIW